MPQPKTTLGRMPREAIRMGGAAEVLPLDRIAWRLIGCANPRTPAASSHSGLADAAR